MNVLMEQNLRPCSQVECGFNMKSFIRFSNQPRKPDDTTQWSRSSLYWRGHGSERHLLIVAVAPCFMSIVHIIWLCRVEGAGFVTDMYFRTSSKHFRNSRFIISWPNQKYPLFRLSQWYSALLRKSSSLHSPPRSPLAASLHASSLRVGA